MPASTASSPSTQKKVGCARRRPPPAHRTRLSLRSVTRRDNRSTKISTNQPSVILPTVVSTRVRHGTAVLDRSISIATNKTATHRRKNADLQTFVCRTWSPTHQKLLLGRVCDLNVGCRQFLNDSQESHECRQCRRAAHVGKNSRPFLQRPASRQCLHAARLRFSHCPPTIDTELSQKCTSPTSRRPFFFSFCCSFSPQSSLTRVDTASPTPRFRLNTRRFKSL